MTAPGLTRRSFLLVAGGGAATVAAGLAGMVSLELATGGSLLGRPGVRTSDDPVLRELDGSDLDAAPALNAFLERAGSRATIDGRFVTDAAVELPESLAHLTFAAGSAIKVRGSHSGLARSGSIELREKTGHTMEEGAVSFRTDHADRYEVDEYLLLSGDNKVAGSSDKYGYLRRVTSIDGGTVNIDRPLPRTIDKSPRTSSVTLAPPVVIDGAGEVYNLDPRSGKKSLVTLRAVDQPIVSGIDVHSNGGIGVTVAHCRGGRIECTVRDLLDDGKDYFGYGVNVSGSTRDVFVGGFMTRVRHAVTTNAGSPIEGVGSAGEPEDCTFAPRAEDCSNKAIDTHRLGWGITMIPDVAGGAGGVQVRADNVRVLGGSVSGTTVSGITVASVVRVPPSIEGVTITDVTDGTGIRCRGPAHIRDCSISDTPGPAVELRSDSSIDGLTIRRGGEVGVRILGDNNSVREVTTDTRSTVAVVEAEKADNNTIVLRTSREPAGIVRRLFHLH
ncbi:hypothetical protein NVV95_04035 [Herbiconiux sp. CPCC 205716]|uniref:Right-handed parallel beta-helix repeat-containing protein n=1 Tax=Herbiconiux gentiana TaxID=2970912 RepID=A0ABT2GFP7_9MICO|nr:hypothetical protein [Herbiconiux gentiana]MCS5713719.1 hypothetical protein [Herbiconiux gentiana]